jgi:hypothetical protein
LITAMSVTAIPGSAAWASSVTVNATDSIWLAGQAAGASVSGYFGSDTAPGNSPVLINLTASVLTFSATGSTSVDGGAALPGPMAVATWISRASRHLRGAVTIMVPPTH